MSENRIIFDVIHFGNLDHQVIFIENGRLYYLNLGNMKFDHNYSIGNKAPEFGLECKQIVKNGLISYVV